MKKSQFVNFIDLIRYRLSRPDSTYRVVRATYWEICEYAFQLAPLPTVGNGLYEDEECLIATYAEWGYTQHPIKGTKMNVRPVVIMMRRSTSNIAIRFDSLTCDTAVLRGEIVLRLKYLVNNQQPERKEQV